MGGNKLSDNLLHEWRNPSLRHYYHIQHRKPHIYLPQPTKHGYAFTGWYTNANLLGDKVTYIPTGSTGHKSFYAAWEYIQYTITYNLNGGINPIDAPTGYNIDSSFALPIPTKAGYDFAGWYNNASQAKR